MPVAIPSWRKVLLIPDAIPARSWRTVETAVDASGALTIPIPMPPITKPGIRLGQFEPTLMRLIDHIAIAFSASPAPSRIRIGMRVESRPAIGAATNETRLSGRKQRPVWSGESPRMFCR